MPSLKETIGAAGVTLVFAPRFHKAKDLGWWLVLGAPDGELLALKRVGIISQHFRYLYCSNNHATLLSSEYLLFKQDYIKLRGASGRWPDIAPALARCRFDPWVGCEDRNQNHYGARHRTRLKLARLTQSVGLASGFRRTSD